MRLFCLFVALFVFYLLVCAQDRPNSKSCGWILMKFQDVISEQKNTHLHFLLYLQE